LSKDGTVLMELQDTFWGAKYAKVRDAYGIQWDLNQ
jgi:PhnB protein